VTHDNRWIEQAHTIDIRTVATALGLQAMTRGSYGPCPCCGAERRGSHDKRGPIGVRDGWRCWVCGETGDTLRLVRETTACSFPDVRAWFAARGWCEAADNRPPPEPVKPPTPAPRTEPKGYPPDAAEVWARCLPATRDRAVTDWLRDRLGEHWLDAAPFVRALSREPRWASYRGSSWALLGYRAVIPLFDSAGVLRSVRSRRVCPGDGPKTLPPAGFDVGGLCMLNPPALALLRKQPLQGWPAPLPIVVTEGEPRFLAWSMRRRECVFGIYSGAWTAGHAAAIPAGSNVLIETDHDGAGDRYFNTVLESLGGRCSVRRR